MSSDIMMLLIKSLGQTLYMVIISMLIASALGIPLGILLVTTAKEQILQCTTFNRILA